MSLRTPTTLIWSCLAMCVWLRPLTAQSTIVRLMEQMILMMESMNDRQMALMEQMHSTLRSVERRMEETKYLDGRQVALLRSIDRRMEERNEGLKCFRGNDGKRSCYKFVQVKMTRDGARTHCRNIGDGVDLVSIESQQHTNFLSSVIKGLPATCALYHTSGEKKSGVWQWTATGQPFNYIGWAPREPNDSGNFCFIWNQVPGWKTWDDRPDTEACFICDYQQ